MVIKRHTDYLVLFHMNALKSTDETWLNKHTIDSKSYFLINESVQKDKYIYIVNNFGIDKD